MPQNKYIVELGRRIYRKIPAAAPVIGGRHDNPPEQPQQLLDIHDLDRILWCLVRCWLDRSRVEGV